MKKLSVFLFTLLMMVCISACNDSVPSETQDNSIAVIEAYIDQLMQTQEMQSSIEYCKANNMDHCLEARRDTLVYKYTYTVLLPDSAKDVLLAQYDSAKDLLIPLAEGVKQEISAVKTVVWEYYNADGTLIAKFPF